MAKLNEQNTVMLETADNNMDEVVHKNSSDSCTIRGMRYIILISTLICLSSIMANITTFNFTVLCIKPNYRNDLSYSNETTENNGNNEGYTKEDRTMILSSVAIGALVTILFITHALQYFGLRVIFFASGMLTAISTMLVPLAISQNSIVYFIILRILQGVSFTVCMPTTGAITSSWASLKQNGFFISTLVSFGQLSSVFTMATSGVLCASSVGWPAVYYLHGGVSFIVFGIWVLLYRNQPVDHPLYFGLRVIFFASGMLTAISTMLVPLAISQNSIVYFIILRILQGVSFTVCMPTTGAITSSWASLKQNGFFISTLVSFGQLSSVFTMATSGVLCASSVGWPAVYYLHGGVSFIVFGIWVLLYRNQPVDHPLVNEMELNEINSGRSPTVLKASAKKHQKIPYLAILSTPAIWGVWAAAIADLMTLQLIQMFGPQYINEILGYSVEATGFSAALSVLVQFLFKIFAGYTSDRLRILSETAKLRLYNSIALGISAVFLIILAFLPRGYPLTGVVLLTLATSMYGFNGGGFNKCATLVSRQYSAFVLGHIQIIWCISMLLSPILVNGLLGEGTIYDWRIIFIIHAILSLATNVYFCIVAVSDAAWWTDDERVKIRMRSGNFFWWWKNEP
ncbi:Sialin [Dirofilaria immitis]